MQAVPATAHSSRLSNLVQSTDDIAIETPPGQARQRSGTGLSSAQHIIATASDNGYKGNKIYVKATLDSHRPMMLVCCPTAHGHYAINSLLSDLPVVFEPPYRSVPSRRKQPDTVLFVADRTGARQLAAQRIVRPGAFFHNLPSSRQIHPGSIRKVSEAADAVVLKSESRFHGT